MTAKAVQIPTAWWVGDAIKDTKTSVFVVTAGLGSGKTHGKAHWGHDRVLKNWQTEFSCFVEPTYQKIFDAALPKYKKILQLHGFNQNRDYKVYKSPFPKIIYTGSPRKHEVHFISGDNPDSIVAVEYSHAVIDEAGIISGETLDNVQSRIRDTRATCLQTFMGGAPQGVNDFADRFDSVQLEGWNTDHWRKHTKTDVIEGVEVSTKRYIVWTDDNAHNLPPGYIQRNIVAPYGHNQNLIKSYRYGLFCPFTTGAAYSNYLPQKHDIDDIEPNEYREIALCLDFNKSPLAWVAAQPVPFDEVRRLIRWVVVHEGSESTSHLDDAAIEFAKKFPLRRFRTTPINLYGDRSGHAESHKSKATDYEAFAAYLEELGYENVEICASEKVAPETASVDAVQRLFSHTLLLVCKRCRLLRKSWLATCWKKGVRKLDKPQGETWTHHSDAFKYFAWQELREFDGGLTEDILGTS